MTPTIRLASLEDVDDLVRIETRAFDPSIYPQTSRRQFRYLLTKGNAEIWVAVSGGQVCGSAVLFFRRSSKFIRFYSLSVDPDFQGGEIGKLLFAHSESRVKARGMRGMLCEIRQDNQRLYDRYQSIGYMPYRRVTDYYPDGMACIKMKKVF